MIAVRNLEQAADDFRALGFTLTPRGHHSMGSQNHCIMFRSTYVELLAAPEAHPWLDYYRAFLERGDGLAAIALSTDDADATARALGGKAPIDLSRPVEGGVARFRLVQIEDLPSVFVCQHLTRELVWRPEWQSHANGTQELVGVTMPMMQRVEGLLPSIQWGGPATLRLRGSGNNVEAHGVRLEFS